MQIPTVSSDPGSRSPLDPEIKLCSLPPFSAAAAKLLQLSEAEDVDLRTILPVLASDPSLAADVLRLANSPLFATTHAVRSIEHAVVFLGLERVKGLAVAIAMRRYSTGACDGAYRQCWEHSLACAVVAEELAEFYAVRKEDAYTAGLLHDIGRAGLLKAYPKEYIPVLKTEYQRLDESLALEQCLLRMDHCMSGSFLGKVWAFPQSLQTVAERHHSARDLNESILTTVIRVACALADAIGFPEVNYQNRPGIDGALQLLDHAAVDRFRMRVPFVEERTKEKIAYFLTS